MRPRPFSRLLCDSLAFGGFCNFCGEVFFDDFDAFANFKTDETGDGRARFFCGFADGQVRVHTE